MSRGFVLVEVSIAYVIMTLAIVALVPVFIIAIKANKNTEKISAATGLSVELLEEVHLRKWDHNTSSATGLHIDNPSLALGVDAGESAADKTTFDDIDDFNGWSEAGVRDPMMGAVTAFSGYSRSVAVSYVDSNLAVAASTTDFKQVTVCSQTDGLKPLCLNTLFTNR